MNSLIRGLSLTIAVSSMALLVAGKSLVRADDADVASVPEATSSPVNVVGTWVGTNSICMGCAFDLDIKTQKGVSFHGTFSLETGMDTPSGKLTGKVNKDGSLSMTLHATMGSRHNCTAKAMATLTDANDMTGMFTVIQSAHCSGTGSFTAAR